MSIFILGINSVYHEPAACLLKNGKIVAAVEEERFNRIRHGKSPRIDNPHILPTNSISYCLKEAGIGFEQIDHIGFSFDPEIRLAKNVGIENHIKPYDWGSEEGEKLYYTLLKSIPDKLSELMGINCALKFRWIEHHLCHAASSFFTSPFKEAAILSTDGIGEFTSIWMGCGRGNKINVLKEIAYPNSIGFLWTKLSRFLGFTSSGYGEYGAGKIMGLSAYGNPNKYYSRFRKFIDYDSDGNLFVDNNYLQFRINDYSKLEEIFGKTRLPDELIESRHCDLAASLQKITNEILLAMGIYIYKETNSNNLCRAGGVALNCVSNSFLNNKGPFDKVYIQPAANDMGTSVGSAYYIWNHLLENPKKYVMYNSYLGPQYSDDEIENILKDSKLVFTKVKDIESTTAQLIADGNIIAWFQGRMEFGPRALGNRSILADPRRFYMVDILNAKVKHREYFRPFAPSVLEEKTREWFELNNDTISNRSMLLNYNIRKDKIGKVPAVTHIDDSCRIQVVRKEINPKFHKVITEFDKLTKIPMILNTSFNDMEPIICSPKDAVNTCLKTKLDYLVISNYLVEIKQDNNMLPLFSNFDEELNIRDFFIKLSSASTFRKSFLRNSNQNNQITQNDIAQEIAMVTQDVKLNLERMESALSFNPEATKVKDYITSRR